MLEQTKSSKEMIELENPEPVIEINDLVKSFGQKRILQGVTLNLYKGENLVILGKSGTGKSVLIKCIVGLLAPESGEIKLFDKNIKDTSKKEFDLLRQKVGFLFQNGALYDSMTVRENLEFPLVRIRKELSKAQRLEKITSVLENVGLTDVLYKMPSELSGGMRKRVSLARTLVVDPLIMLYDEPTTGLDPSTSDEISNLINEVQKKYKTSSIIITHDINCAMKTADRLILLSEGKVYIEGTKEDFKNSSDETIKSFFI